MAGSPFGKSKAEEWPLLVLFTQPLTIIAEPVAARPCLALVLRDVAARSTRAVVVVNTISLWFVRLISGMKLCRLGHLVIPFQAKV